MFRVRTTKTSSGGTAVQIIFNRGHKIKLLKHVGTANNAKELEDLKILANQYISSSNKFPPLIPEALTDPGSHQDLVSLKNLSVSRAFHHFAREILIHWYNHNGFGKINNPILRDLVIMRIIEPASKLYTLSLLPEYFDVKYPKNKVYDYLKQVPKLKDPVESLAFEYAKKNFILTYSLVFYDVTTLYFETSVQEDADGLNIRRPGFSKDNKSNQPQILIGLLVNREGYPLAYDIFPGNTFEGKTFIPVILGLKQRFNLGDLTVVADAAMLSLSNMEELQKQGLHYIVGARLANLPTRTITSISQALTKTENKYYQTQTSKGTLICDYSHKRAIKDKSDRNKQLRRAQYQIDHPEQILKRSRFIITETAVSLSQKLIRKDELLDGLKGYYTNLREINNQTIVSRYKDLWHVEKSFRIAKSDLLARPVFHYKKDSIEAHILIVFMALCLTKSIELKTQLSTKRVKRLIWRIMDVELIDKLTGKHYPKRMELGADPDLFRLINIPKSAY